MMDICSRRFGIGEGRKAIPGLEDPELAFGLVGPRVDWTGCDALVGVLES